MPVTNETPAPADSDSPFLCVHVIVPAHFRTLCTTACTLHTGCPAVARKPFANRSVYSTKAGHMLFVQRVHPFTQTRTDTKHKHKHTHDADDDERDDTSSAQSSRDGEAVRHCTRVAHNTKKKLGDDRDDRDTTESLCWPPSCVDLHLRCEWGDLSDVCGEVKRTTYVRSL